jgi:colanic acid biosynthesis glycosyl transferase WcaI
VGLPDSSGPSRRRFLFLNQYFLPDEAATAQLLGDLVEAAAASGHECRVVASDRGYLDPRVVYPRRQTLGGAVVERVRVTGFGRHSRLGRVTDYATFLFGAAVRLLAGPRPDVVVGMSTPPILGALAAAAAKVRGAQSAYWAMDVYPDLAFVLGALRPDTLLGKLFAAFSARTLEAADLVVAPGEFVAGRLVALGARNAVTVAIHNWADGDAIRPFGREESRFRRERGWTGRFVVLYSGNLGIAHDFGTLLDAAEALRGDGTTLFAFCGGGPRMAEVRVAAERRGLKNVEFHPAVERAELGDLLGAGDVHAVTLAHGTPGLLVPSKLYGSLAAGRPVLYVGPEEGEAYGVVHEGRCGACHPLDDADGVVRSLVRWRDDVSAREEDGRRGRLLFEARFTKAGQTAKLVSALESLAAAAIAQAAR